LVETLSRKRRHRHDGTAHDIYISVSTLAHVLPIMMKNLKVSGPNNRKLIALFTSVPLL
jgi:hypothetical protein